MLVYDKYNDIQPDEKYVYREINGLKLPVYIYNPRIRNQKNKYVVICIHGGGWKTGITQDSNWCGGDMVHQAKIFSQLGYTGIAISYRAITNEQTDISDLIDDCKCAIRFIKEKLDIDNDKIIIIGDSAGAHLATVLGICNDDSVRPYMVIACNPVLDCTGVFAYSSGSEEKRISASPIFAEIKKSAKFLFIHGDEDKTTPIKNTITMNKKLNELGFDSELITLKGVLHAFMLYDYRSTDDEVIKYMEMIEEYLNKKLNKEWNNIKRGIRAHDVRATGLDNICKCCIQNKLSHIQLVLEKTIDNFIVGKYSEEYAATLKEKLCNVQIAVLGSYINPSNPSDIELRADIEKFKEKIRYATFLKPIVVGTETGVYKSGETDSEEAYQRVLSSIREILSYAESLGVYIGIEGVYCFVINTPQKMKRLMDDLNSDYAKVIFDPVNYLNISNYTKQDEIINDMFDLLSDKICVLHAKDFVVENGEIRNVKPTEGILNYKLIFERMSDYDLDIPVICEEINEIDASDALDKLELVRRKEQ